MNAMQLLGLITFTLACVAIVLSCWYSARGDRSGARACLGAAAVAYGFTLMAVLL